MFAEPPFVLRGHPFSANGLPLFSRARSKGVHSSIVHVGSIAEKLHNALTNGVSLSRNHHKGNCDVIVLLFLQKVMALRTAVSILLLNSSFTKATSAVSSSNKRAIPFWRSP